MSATARRIAVVALLSPVLLLIAWALAPDASYGLAMLVHAVTLIGAGVAMGRAARRGDVLLRRARRWLTAGLAASGTGFVVAAVESAVRGEVPAVGFANLAPLVWVPCVLTGMLAVPSQEHREGGRARALLDGIVVAAALSLGSWVVFLQPTWQASSRTGLEKGVLLAYPVIDLMLAIAALAMAAHARSDMRRFLHAAVAGLLMVAIADSGTALAVARGSDGFEWHNVVLQAGLALLLVAAMMPTANGAADDSHVGVIVDAALPHVPVMLAAGVVAVHVVTGHRLDASSIVLGTVVLTGVVLRQRLYAQHLVAVARRLSVEATHDPLTGLFNRRACLRGMGTALAERRPGDVALVLLDLNGFKEVNDTFGHAAGDVALRDVAARVRATSDATAARLGGDEFAVLFVGRDVERRAAAAALALTQTVPTSVGTFSVAVSGCAGVTVSRVGDTTSTLLRRADLALYEAKRGRGTPVVSFVDAMAVHAERRHLLADALPGAAERGELHVQYQPLIDLADGSIHGAEALLRWTSPLHGSVAPDEFIPLAEDSGLITDIGMWVLERATADMADRLSTGHPVPQLFVNVSPQQLVAGFASSARALVAARGLEPARVNLEVTESAAPDEAALRCLHELHAVGFGVVIDDFGSGFSSLSQLAMLPADVLKFDQAFLRGIHTPNGRRIVDAVIAMAADLGLTTVAEGVETLADVEAVQRAGCSLAQGYYVSRPVPVAELWTLMDSRALVPFPRMGPVTATAALPGPSA